MTAINRTVAAAAAWTLIFPAGVLAQGSLRDSIAREAARAALSAAATQTTQPEEDWNAVLGLKPNVPVRVTGRDGRTIVGSLSGANSDRVVIDKRWGGHEALRREDVGEIRMRPRLSKAGFAGIGALIGLVGGALSGWSIVCAEECTAADRKLGLILGGAVGVGAGLGWGTAAYYAEDERLGRVIYRAPAAAPLVGK